jgi:hypothetical protein
VDDLNVLAEMEAMLHAMRRDLGQGTLGAPPFDEEDEPSKSQAPPS